MGFVFFSSRRRHTRFDCDWSSDVCSSDLVNNITTPGGSLIENVAVPERTTSLFGRVDSHFRPTHTLSLFYKYKDSKLDNQGVGGLDLPDRGTNFLDRKSTRLNSSHSQISYAVFCLKKKKNIRINNTAPGTTNTPPYAIDLAKQWIDQQALAPTATR